MAGSGEAAPVGGEASRAPAVLSVEAQFGRMRQHGDDFNDGGAVVGAAAAAAAAAAAVAASSASDGAAAAASSSAPAATSAAVAAEAQRKEEKEEEPFPVDAATGAWVRVLHDHVAATTPAEVARFESELRVPVQLPAGSRVVVPVASDSVEATAAAAVGGGAAAAGAGGVAAASQSSSCELRVRQRKMRSQGEVGRTVWDSAIVLAKYLERRTAAEARTGGVAVGAGGEEDADGASAAAASFIRGRRVVELGAGCAVSGMVASLLGAAHVDFTDVHKLLAHMRENVESNLGRLGVPRECYKLRALDWLEGGESLARFKPPVDLVLGADIVYTERTVRPMLRTAARLLGATGRNGRGPPRRRRPAGTGGSGVVARGEFILAFEGHVPEAAEKFWDCVEEYFDVAHVPAEELDPRWQDEEINVLILTLREVVGEEDDA